MRGKKQHTFLSEGAEMKEFKGKGDVAILTSQKSAVKMMTCGLWLLVGSGQAQPCYV